MENKVLLIKQDLMQAIVRYLETKPFVEVHALLAAILEQCNAKPAAVPPAAPPDQENASGCSESPV